MNYTDLVKKIRHCATDPMHCLTCDEDKDGRCFARLMREAADAIEALQRNLNDCRNELCLYCGQYRQRHKGACDGCRWMPKEETE